jgi:NAD+ synthetase
MTELFADKFKNKILSQKRGLIGIAQINPIAGNIEYNAKKVVKYINLAQSIELDLVVFPELTLMGYPIEDTIDRYPIIVEDNIKWLKEIAKITTKTCAIIGFVEPREDINVGKKYYNSLAVIQNGAIKSIVRKSLLPTYCEFNDYRYFEPSPVVGCQSADTLCNFDESKVKNCSKTITINGIKYGILICEDCWNNKEFFNDNILYSKDPIQELSEEEPDIFINCSASTTRAKKEQLKYNMLSFISKKYKTPLVYVNQVGAIDNNSFDGSSKVFDSDGKLIARAKSFEEQFLIVNPIKNIGEIYPLTNGPEKTLTEAKAYTLEYNPDLERTYKTIVQGIKDYFHKSGFEKAVIGLSGGLDSSVCAVLLADALGKDNVFGISMPSVITSKESKNDARNLAQNLGINFLEASIKNVVDSINNSLKDIFTKVEIKWNNRLEESFTMDNIQARSRAVFLWGISNEFSKTLPIATSDKSELYMGYATINGDMSGGFAPIADVPKTKLFALAKWLNENRAQKNTIPQSVINKKPGAELAINSETGEPLTAEDALMPYEFLDEIIWRIENKKEHYWDMLNSEFLYEKYNKISYTQKVKWLDKFYKRMSNALYKWSIMPPSIIVDSRSINKYDYKQPITSSNINYKGISEIEIFEKIKKINV